MTIQASSGGKGVIARTGEVCVDTPVVQEETFGELLQRLRDRAGLTQEELGQQVGVSETTIQKWESAPGRPKIKNEVEAVRRLAGVLAVPVGVLSSKLDWLPLSEAHSPEWETVIWNDKRFSEEDRQMLIRAGRNALAAKRAEREQS